MLIYRLEAWLTIPVDSHSTRQRDSDTAMGHASVRDPRSLPRPTLVWATCQPPAVSAGDFISLFVPDTPVTSRYGCRPDRPADAIQDGQTSRGGRDPGGGS